jgi:hypothetical protein
MTKNREIENIDAITVLSAEKNENIVKTPPNFLHDKNREIEK